MPCKTTECSISGTLYIFHNVFSLNPEKTAARKLGHSAFLYHVKDIRKDNINLHCIGRSKAWYLSLKERPYTLQSSLVLKKKKIKWELRSDIHQLKVSHKI